MLDPVITIHYTYSRYSGKGAKRLTIHSHILIAQPLITEFYNLTGEGEVCKKHLYVYWH